MRDEILVYDLFLEILNENGIECKENCVKTEFYGFQSLVLGFWV